MCRAKGKKKNNKVRDSHRERKPDEAVTENAISKAHSLNHISAVSKDAVASMFRYSVHYLQ